MRNETAVLTTIKTCRKHHIPESEIFVEIMEDYALTESEAKAYLDKSKESA
ncbi:MAG: hypothetical protein LUH18_00860 [Oscillospiraceae bacterium]|nr:hypothetical protein [Oscillospiraceae bacterium]